MTSPAASPRPQLTPEQAVDVRNARAALRASMADTDPTQYGGHLGALEYHVQQLLELVDELTGGEREAPPGRAGRRRRPHRSELQRLRLLAGPVQAVPP